MIRNLSCFFLLGVLLLASCKGGGGKSAVNSCGPDSLYCLDRILPLTQEIGDHPDKPDAYFRRGLALHSLRDNTADTLALGDFKKAISLDSSKAIYYSAIGDLLFEHKDISGAVPWLKKAIQLDPNDKRAHLKIAKMYLFAREHADAISEINIVLRADAYNPEGYYLKGLVYRDMKDTPQAISSLRTAVSVSSDYRDAHLQLGLIYGAQRNDLALQYFNNAFRLDTTNVEALYAKGMYYQEGGLTEEAKKVYTECILRDRDFADAYFNIGFILMEQDSIEKARRQFDLAGKVDPSNAGAFYNRGLCNEMLNDKPAAIADYRQTLQLDPEYRNAEVRLRALGEKNSDAD